MFPSWRYERYSLFARDARDAEYRLLHYLNVAPEKVFAD
jgi:hypothetical protein